MIGRGRAVHRLLAHVVLAAVAVAALAVPLAAAAPTEPPAFTIHSVRDSGFDARPGGPIFVLFVGTDARAGVEGERGDALHLIGVNPATGATTMINLPRDLWVGVPGHGTTKITMAYWFGRDALTAQTVSELVGVPISYVVSTDFAGFQGLVDDMGGIDVDVPFAMNEPISGAVFPAGPAHMTGGQALAFSRNRYVPNGDLLRTQHQALLMVTALGKARAEATSPASTLRLIGIMARRTRLQGGSWTDAYRMARLALSIDPASIRNVTVPARLGFAGPEAVVFLGPGAGELFADFRDDATLQSH